MRSTICTAVEEGVERPRWNSAGAPRSRRRYSSFFFRGHFSRGFFSS